MNKHTLGLCLVVTAAVALLWWWSRFTPTHTPKTASSPLAHDPRHTVPGDQPALVSPPTETITTRSRPSLPAATATAHVSVGNQQFSVQATPDAVFVPRVNTAVGARPVVRVKFRDGEPGEPVVVQVEDGGALENHALTQLARLDEQRQIQFAFQMTQNPGLFRVVVRKGGEAQTLEFWAGPPLPVAKN